MSFYPVREDDGRGPGSAWFNVSVTTRPVTDHEIHRARLYVASRSHDAEECAELLDMVGLGADLQVKGRR